MIESRPGRVSPLGRVLLLVLGFIVVFSVAAVAAALGWREGLRHRTDAFSGSAYSILAVPLCGLLGSFLSVIVALFVMALLTIAVTVLRKRRRPSDRALPEHAPNSLVLPSSAVLPSSTPPPQVVKTPTR